MPIEAKPLFRPDVLRPHLAAFTLPDRVTALRSMLERWADLIASLRIDRLNEQEILPDFLTDFFVGLLGYTGPAGGQRYTISREQHVEVAGKFADAVLGELRAESDRRRFVVAVEGKGPRDPLTRPFGGRRLSAVEQGYQYAVNLPCDWVIVTSIRQTRLYRKRSDQQTYELFDTEQLASDDALLKKFVFLLGAERVVPTSGECHLEALFAASEQVGRELTKDFYIGYANMRQDAFEQLARDNPSVPRSDVLARAQKLLDRVLFCAFAEDRGLLPPETIKRAFEHRDPYHPRPIWDTFRSLFGAINRGNAALGIHAYNGGLFADDPVLDGLQVSDEVCGYFRDLGSYDYRPPSQAAAAAPTAGNSALIDVDILGHIFEQSITDLELLRQEVEGLAEPLGVEKHKSRRKKEGAFYTPAFITRYIVEQALGGVLADRFEALRATHEAAAKGAAKTALADPRVYDLDVLKKPQRAALVKFWEAWQDELATVRLLDPACGSGAFLIEAFDQMHSAYSRANARLAELEGLQSTFFDLDKQILEKNLFGVDLNEEAIEICRLSLWIKTAQRGKALTSLDDTIRVGNSIVGDASLDPKALDWRAEFRNVFRAGGFDVVVGNPPYVRQELLTPIKPYLEENYRTFHGMADLYVYFYELGLRVLKPGGRLSFIVTNKWMKAGYGEPLRQFFAEQSWMESVVNFGHAKQIFEDADVFPSIIVARKPSDAPAPASARVCDIPREQLRIDDLSRQIAVEGFEVARDTLDAGAWNLEPRGVLDLMAKIRERGCPLAEFAGVQPLLGIKTGFNDAFLIDTAKRDALVASHPGCINVIKPYLRGQDLERWAPNWAGLWMIAMKSSENHAWPWADANEQAERVFQQTFPSLHAHMKPYESQLKGRQDQGRHWWELRSCAYWSKFEEPKTLYQDITWQSRYCVDVRGTLSNNTVYILPSVEPWALAALNSPIGWWFSWRAAQHGKDEALRLFKVFLETYPIPPATDEQRASAAIVTKRLIEIANAQHAAIRDLLDWLRVEYAIEKPTLKLQAPVELDSDAFVAEVRKVRGKNQPLSAAGLKALREEYDRTLEPARQRAAEALTLERRLSDLVNEAYGLTPAEVDLMWRTAPPRMPIPAPQ